MRIESQLCHFSEKRIIVLVNGWINDKNVGSALAEGATVELAEDKAISRLSDRLKTTNLVNLDSNKERSANILNKIKEEPKNQNNLISSNNGEEPNDWSNELASIDLEIKRLKWDRDTEVKFLKDNLGYNNRTKITKYSELLKYLNTLKKLDSNDLSNITFNEINSLLEESEILLKELSWDYKKGREYLLKEFNVLTRKELNKNQLITFVEKLKFIRKQGKSG
tara:strand:+ start:819 stop:1487 length:669 start_codon:yes stop_codon:yes gene_type:complete